MNPPKLWIETECVRCKGAGGLGPYRIPTCDICKGLGYELKRFYATDTIVRTELMQRDAARYRWLRDKSYPQKDLPLVVLLEQPMYGKELDAVVDAAMRK